MGVETWAPLVRHLRCLEASQMRCLRYILCIQLATHGKVTNSIRTCRSVRPITDMLRTALGHLEWAPVDTPHKALFSRLGDNWNMNRCVCVCEGWVGVEGGQKHFLWPKVTKCDKLRQRECVCVWERERERERERGVQALFRLCDKVWQMCAGGVKVKKEMAFVHWQNLWKPPYEHNPLENVAKGRWVWKSEWKRRGRYPIEPGEPSVPAHAHTFHTQLSRILVGLGRSKEIFDPSIRQIAKPKTNPSTPLLGGFFKRHNQRRQLISDVTERE
jgi:hypothetical protein